MKRITLSLLLLLIALLSASGRSYERLSEQSADPESDAFWVLGAAECDFDGDGAKETVTLKCDKDEYETVFAEISGGGISFRETLFHTHFMNIEQILSVDLDGDGGEELVVVANTGANGGYGGKSLTILTLDGASLRRLHAGGLCGFSASGRLLPRFEAEITVTETGETFTFPILDAAYLKHEGYYNEDGELLMGGAVYADAICYVMVNHENGVVEIAQYIWSETHTNGEGFLVTELSFAKTGYSVVSQLIEPLEYAERFAGSD